MDQERRRFMRFELPLGVDIDAAQAHTITGAMIKDVSREGISIVAKNFDVECNHPLTFQVHLPENDIKVPVLGQVRWKKQVNDSWQAGIKFTSIDSITKGDLLSYAYDRWVTKMRSQNYSVS